MVRKEGGHFRSLDPSYFTIMTEQHAEPIEFSQVSLSAIDLHDCLSLYQIFSTVLSDVSNLSSFCFKIKINLTFFSSSFFITDDITYRTCTGAVLTDASIYINLERAL